jgi:acetyl-CoA C-acetyltransferase
VPLTALVDRNRGVDFGASRPARATSTSPPASRPSRASATRRSRSTPSFDGSDGSIFNVYIPMGLTAENVADRCKVSREAQDEWAATSQQRAVAARDSGHLDREIVAVTLEDGTQVTQDDGPRPGTIKEKLAELKPVFRPDGTVTAGNACPLNDGAAAGS